MDFKVVKQVEFGLYAKIHQKIDLHAGLTALSERKVHEIIMTEEGLLKKQNLLTIVKNNMAGITRWAKSEERSGPETQVARNMFLQFRGIADGIETQIKYISTYLEGKKTNGSA